VELGSVYRKDGKNSAFDDDAVVDGI